MTNLFKQRSSLLVLLSCICLAALSCSEERDPDITGSTSDIVIDSLTASLYKVKAWDSTTIFCYAQGKDIEYVWECDHGNFNGGGMTIRYAAGECCVGINTITCTVQNDSGFVSADIQIEVTSYFDFK